MAPLRSGASWTARRFRETDQVFEWLITQSIRHRVAVLIGTVVLVSLGARAYGGLAIDAIPDLTNVQVQVLTSAPALAPLDVERLVTAHW